MLCKDSLRKDALARRKTISSQEREQAAVPIKNFLQAYLKPNATSCIAGYWPIRGELDVLPVLQTYERCFLPVSTAKNTLIFRQWNTDTVMIKDIFGIPAPDTSSLEDTPDILLIPLLAFTRNGDRLGYGSGCYDKTLRLLRQKKNITAIGIGFSIQEVEKLPIEPYDQRLDSIVTEKEFIRVENGRTFKI